MIDFTLYPNLNGQLGQNKVQMPDGVTTFWPDGDALVGNFIYKNGKLSGFVDTKALISNDAKSTTIPYDYFEAELENVREDSVKFNLGERCKNFTLKLMPKYKGCKTIDDIVKIEPNYKTVDIVDGIWSKDLEDYEGGGSMFSGCESLTTFTSNLPSLINGDWMFHSCSNLTTFYTNLNSLTYGKYMFWCCSNLSSFTSDLSSLTNGFYMFYGCSNLISFDINLKSLTDGTNMFRDCSNLTTFDSNLNSLTNSTFMFYGCSNLSSFKCSNLNSLVSAEGMFYKCKFDSFDLDLRYLTHGGWMFNACSNLCIFNSNLSSLTNGEGMFIGCKLNTQSIKNIAETINTVTDSPSIMIGIGNKTPSEEENTYLTQIHNKGWQVYVNGAGDVNIFNPTSLIPIDGEQNINHIPFWAKPVPSTQEEANYMDENGNFFNILGGQFIYVNDPESYGMFTSEEDAAAQMRLTKIEKEDI